MAGFAYAPTETPAFYQIFYGTAPNTPHPTPHTPHPTPYTPHPPPHTPNPTPYTQHPSPASLTGRSFI
ncbi:MAG: hypothetical protein F6J93_28505 [Oscillatoria sp. SIO1A7]|nr:hypothetical protein [Oscillatoria sp. SIO1A7]